MQRGAKRWYPDAEYIKQFQGPILYTDETEKRLPVLSYFNKRILPEKQVKNLILNFGPQHPAAHGVLRLVLELDGEVSKQIHKLFIRSKNNDVKEKCKNTI